MTLSLFSSLHRRTLLIAASAFALAANPSYAAAGILDNTDVAVVWTGMKHAWDREVHRSGKLGNWVNMSSSSSFPKSFSLHHLAEAGSESDNASFSVLYDLVQATNTRFIPGTKSFHIQVSENSTPTINQHVTIPVSSDAHLADKTRFAAVLGGFELKVTNGSDALKLGTLELVASTPVLSQQNIEFDITGELFMSCDSAECPWFKTNTQIDYTLDVHYLLVASTDDWFHPVKHNAISKSYDYNSGNEVPESLGALDAALSPVPDEGYAVSVTAMRGFRFEVSKETSIALPDPVPHLYKWKMWGNLSGSISASPHFTGQAFFAHSSKGVLNIGHNGHVTMRIHPLTLQFKVGLLKQCAWSETRAFGSVEQGGKVQYDNSGQITDLGNFACLP